MAEQEGFLADWDAATEYITDIKNFNNSKLLSSIESNIALRLFL